MLSSEKEIKASRVAVSVYYFIIGIVFATWASRIPDIKSSMELSDAVLGGVLFSIPIGQISAIGFSAYLVGRFGSYRMLSIAIWLSCLTMLSISFVNTIAALSVALFFFGAATNLSNLAVNTQGVDVESLYSKNIMGSFHGLWSMGCFVGALISTVMDLFGLDIVTHFVIIFLAVITSALISRKSLVRKDIRHSDVAPDDKRNFFQRIDGYIMLLGITSFCAMMCEGAMFDWSGVYFSDVVKCPDNLVRLGYIVCMSTMTLGRFLSDSFVMRYGVVKVIKASGLLIALGLLISVAAPTLITASIGFFIVGFGISSTVPSCYSLSARSKSLMPATALATVTTIGYMGFLIGPPIIGFIAEALSLRWTFGIIAIIALFITFFAGRLKRYL